MNNAVLHCIVRSKCFGSSINYKPKPTSSYQRCSVCSKKTIFFPSSLFLCHEFVEFAKNLFGSCNHYYVFATQIFIHNSKPININYYYADKQLCLFFQQLCPIVQRIIFAFKRCFYKMFFDKYVK